MKISQLKKDIEYHLAALFEEQGFNEKGELGEFYKTTQNNKYGVLIESLKDSESFSISVRILIHFHNIERIFDKVSDEYTLNKYLAAESITFENYSSNKVKEILYKLIKVDVNNFFSKYGDEKKLFANFNDPDYRNCISSDKTTIFKVRLASASLLNNTEALSSIKDEAMKYCSKQWAQHDKDKIKKLCSMV